MQVSLFTSYRNIGGIYGLSRDDRGYADEDEPI
jgi:hypothetical protein